MRTPSSALPAWPYGLVDGFGKPLPLPLPFFTAARLAAGFLALSLTTVLLAFLADFFAVGLALALLFLRVAIVVSSASRFCSRRLLLLQRALRVEVADAAALAAGGRVEHRVDQRRLARIHGGIDGAAQLVGRRRIDADAAERLDHLVVAGALDEHGRRRIGARLVDVGAAINAVIVEDDDAHRQPVPADGLDLHAGEAEGAVAFDRQHRLSGLDRGADRVAHADAHDAPGADVDALARLVDVDDAAGEVERIGALVDEDRVRPLLDDGAQHAELPVIVHRRVVVHQPRRHLGDVVVALRRDGLDPVRRRRLPGAHAGQQRGDAGADVA